METVKRVAATQSLAKEDLLESNECTGGLNEWVGGSRRLHAAAPSKSMQLFSMLQKSVPEAGSPPECEKKDLDLARTCKDRGVVPLSLPETFYTRGLLQACALASLQHQFHRRRDLLTALHLLFGIEEPDNRRLQSHQTFLKKKKQKDIVLFPA